MNFRKQHSIWIIGVGVFLLAATAAHIAPPVQNDASTEMSQERWLHTPAEASDLKIRGYRTPNESREETLGKRMEHRSFDGAPPVMPHAASYGDNKSCLDCHGQGFTMGKKIARAIPHPDLTNCVQCHIEGESDFIGEVAVIPNTFAGLEPLLGGERSFEGAPPTMPHELFMRTNCIACHGSQGYSGLLTDHPERRNCIQCHTPTSFLMN